MNQYEQLLEDHEEMGTKQILKSFGWPKQYLQQKYKSEGTN